MRWDEKGGKDAAWLVHLMDDGWGLGNKYCYIYLSCQLYLSAVCWDWFLLFPSFCRYICGDDKTKICIHTIIVTMYIPSSTEPVCYTSLFLQVRTYDTARDAEVAHMVASITLGMTFWLFARQLLWQMARTHPDLKFQGPGSKGAMVPKLLNSEDRRISKYKSQDNWCK